MILTDDNICELKKLGDKHPIATYVVEEYLKLTQSPYLEGYLTIYRQIAAWNNEIRQKSKKINIVQIQITDDNGNLIGTLDKTFDNTLKYMNALPSLYDKLEYFRSKLLPQELNSIKEYTSDIDKMRNEIKEDEVRQGS